MGDAVCEICGGFGDCRILAKCVECSSYQHRYCMPVVAYSIPLEWRCAKCQEKADGNPRPNQGGRNELQSAYGMTNERETPVVDLSNSSVVHQMSSHTRKRFSCGKVKFISFKEVALLNRGRKPYGRSNSPMRQSQFRSVSLPSSKQYSYMKCVSPTRSDMTPSQYTAASHDNEKIESHSNIENMSEFAMWKSQLHASSPNVKEPSNRNCISPSRSYTQVHTLKRCAAASHDAKKKDSSLSRNVGLGSLKPITNRSRTEIVVKGKVDSRIEDKTKEKKIVSADIGTTSQFLHEHKEKEALYASVDATGCESEMKSQSHDKGTLLIMNSNAEYSRHPSKHCWTGSFLVLHAGTSHEIGEFKAYFPSKVSYRIYEITNEMPAALQFEMLPRSHDWPITFEINNPTHEDIALFFLTKEFDGHQKKNSDLLETSCNYVMRTYINDIKLLIYSSELLPPDSQWVDGRSYLWGVFVRPKGSRRHLSSTST